VYVVSLAQDRRNVIHTTGIVAHAVDLYLRGRSGASGICKVAIGEIRGDIGGRQDKIVRDAITELCECKYPDGVAYLTHDLQSNVFYFPRAARDCPPRTRVHLEARRKFGRLPDCEPRRVFLRELAEIAERFPDDPASLDGAARDALAGEQLGLGLDQQSPPLPPVAPAPQGPRIPPPYQPLIDAVDKLLPEVELPRSSDVTPTSETGQRLMRVWLSSKADSRRWVTYLQAVRQLSLGDGCIWFGEVAKPVTLDLLLQEGICDAVLRMARAGPGRR
jgi:hypothetical protein